MATLLNAGVQGTPLSAQIHFIIFVISALLGLIKPSLVLIDPNSAVVPHC